jgi:hypothetical protein
MLAWLLTASARRSRDVPAERSWIVASAIALGLFQLGEPVNVVVTPMLFLLVGLCVVPRAHASPAGRRPLARGTSVACVALLSAAVVLSSVAFVGSTLEAWGRTYGELWADRAAHAVAPWRVTAAENLAVRLAVEGRSGNAAAAAEAETLSERTVAAHPWDPTVRFTASDVARLLQHPERAAAWEASQFERFPSDVRPASSSRGS